MIATFSVLVWVVGSHPWWVRTRLPIMSSSRLKFIFTLCSVAGTWENATPSEIPHKHTNYYYLKAVICCFVTSPSEPTIAHVQVIRLLSRSVVMNEIPGSKVACLNPKAISASPSQKNNLDLVTQTQEWLNLRAHRGFLSFIQLKASSCFSVRKAS